MRYSSSARLLGLPLIDVRIGPQESGGVRGVARGWIAMGDVAIGILFSVGGVALGGIALGGIARGLLPLGGLAVGVLALGGAAVGVFAIGGAALGLYAALGGFAVAGSYALGGLAIAPHANEAMPNGFLSTGRVFQATRAWLPYSRWLCFLIPVALLPLFFRKRQDLEKDRFEPPRVKS